MKWLVIADDLSGAADCAIGFAASGWRTFVVLTADRRPEAAAEVIAADVDSRRLSPAEAANRNLAAWESFGGAGRHLYKKIDSTLRGNWAAETAALQRVAGLAIVAPAFPATGRTTRGGCQYVNDQPLEASDIWRLEGHDGRADMVALLSAQGLRVAGIGTDILRGGDAVLRSYLRDLAGQGVQAVVCDALADGDLAALAAAAPDIPHFWVGSGGLARHLSPRSGGAGGASAAAKPSIRGPVLTLVGSLSAVSARQAELLVQRGEIPSLEIPPVVLRAGPSHGDWAGWMAHLAASISAGRDLLVSIGRDDLFRIEEGPRLSEALARMVAPYFDDVGGLIATGGETARAMLQAADIGVLELVSEIEPGVPVSCTLGPAPQHVVTKAGAFGTETALYAAWRHLKQMQA
jgi:uncharacterized protein YgbK (DUF1537 family)